MEMYQETCVSRAFGITFLKNEKQNVTKFEKYKPDWENDSDIDCYL